MTGNTNKTRAVILAALMVFSVFAGTVAFSGSAAAQEYTGGAVQYNDEAGNTGDWIIEVPLDENISTASGITLLDDGDPANGSVDSISITDTSTGSRVVLDLDGKFASNDLEVEFDDTYNSDLEGEYDVEFAATTLDGDVSGNDGLGENKTVFAGETVAFINTSDSVPIEGDDDDNDGYFNTFANGVSSEVFYLTTDDLSGDYEYNESGDFLTVRDLGLGVEIDELNVTTEDDIEGTVTAVDSGRDVTVELIDDSDDTVASDSGELSGQGEFDFELSADRDTGDYTIEVTDNDTQILVESSTITISEEEDDDASFTESTISDQRGDIVEMTVQLESTDFATISVGEDDGSEGVRANATVEDEDGDGEVTVYLNTYHLGPASGDAFAIDDDSDDSITDLSTGDGVEENTDDLIDAGNYDLQVMAGEEQYTEDSDGVATMTLEDRSTETIRMWTGSSEEISPSDLEDVNEAIANGEITQSSEVAVGDLAVHQLVASGFEGALDARENEEVTSGFLQLNRTGPINLTIEEASPGANQDARELDIDSTDNLTVIADGPNDTYFVIVDTEQVDFKNGDDLPNDDDTALETNFTVLQDDAGFDFTPDEEFDDDENSETFVEFTAAEPDVTIDEPFNVSQASGQTVSGTTNIAPGTELSVRVRSESGVSPSFLKTADPVVQPDGTFSATFDFSGQNVGDEYDINVNSQILTDGPTEESGTVVASVATDTATPEPDTDTPEPDTDTPTPEPDTDTATPEPDTDTPMPDTDTPTSTPTSTPGFGVVVALTALLAAALLAVRRD